MSRQRLGQHFLVTASILERIARAACPDPEPLAIEIGPGRGELTGHLLERAARVIAIEIDASMVALIREKFRAEPRLTVIHADARQTELAQWGPAVLVGNLPYYAQTPIIEKALSATLRHAVFLVQKEVAMRLTARPGTRDYGFLSVRTQFLADAEALFDVPPLAFRPPPKVNSTLLRLNPHNRALELGITDPAGFLAFASLCFRQKRKTLRNNLAGVYGCEALNNRPEAGKRAEQLTLDELAAIYRRLVPS